MRGEFIAVWSETWEEIWEPILMHESAPDDLFCELYRDLASALKVSLNAQALAEIVDSKVISAEAFQRTAQDSLSGELAIVDFLERAHDILVELGGDALSNCYFNRLTSFIDKYSLRYDLRRPCQLCPTLPGVFASLVREIRLLANQDAHLNGLMNDFEASVRDLRLDCSEVRIKTCIQKQFNLLEATGCAYPGVTGDTLGKICDQVQTWPHTDLRDALKRMYGFGCDYPGIRHGGKSKNAIRPIDMRDMVAICILLTGFTPYLVDQLDLDVVYRGS